MGKKLLLLLLMLQRRKSAYNSKVEAPAAR
jgi:hypothetical protein